MANAGTLVVDLQANSAAFMREMERARTATERVARGIETHMGHARRAFDMVSRAAGLFGIGLGVQALVQFGAQIVNNVGGLGELAEQLGVSTDALQAYRFAASQAGVSSEQLEGAFIRLSDAIGTASRGEAEAIRSFQRLGVGILDVGGNLRSTEAILNDVADGLLKIEDPARRAAAANDLFGRTGARLLPLLSGGADGLARFRREAEAAGVIIDAGTISRADELADAWAAMRMEVEAIAASPIITVLHGIATALRAIRESGFSLIPPSMVQRIIDLDPDTARRRREDEGRDAAGGIAGILSDPRPRTRNPAARGGGGKDGDAAAILAMQRQVEIAQMQFLGFDRNAALAEAQQRLSPQATQAQIQAITELAGTLYDYNEQRERANELDQLGQSIWDATRTQAEQLADRLAEINFAYSEGAIDLDTYNRAVGDAYMKMSALGDIAEGFGSIIASAFDAAIVRGESLSNVLAALAVDLGRLVLRAAVLGPLEGAIRSGLGSMFGSMFGGGGGTVPGVQPTVTVAPQGFAGGGVMTSRGPVPLRSYAGGGVADSPQVALFGEGAMNEAFVPLPDGRRIPVVMSGGGGRVVNQFFDFSNADRGVEVRMKAYTDHIAAQTRAGMYGEIGAGGRASRIVGRRK